MLYTLSFYFIFFISYSFIGWIVETISCSLIQKKLVLNRGFLIGPYCPIYGWCSLFMILFLNNYLKDPVVLFILTMVAASILEYFTSLVMEKIFKARWWDYSNMPFNIEGRISLINAFLFGILGLVFMYGIHPVFSGFLKSFSETTIIIIGIILFISYLIDNFISFSLITKLKLNIKNMRQDATEIADKEMKKLLASHRFTIKRLFGAFPKMKISLPKGDKILSKIKSYLQDYEISELKRKEKSQLKKENRKK